MFELVDDVDRYPSFVPYCSKTHVISRTENEVKASIALAFGGFEKQFSTLNLLHKPKMMEIRLLDGPFKQLEGFWQFEALDNGCNVSLDLAFEFSHKWIALAFGKIFHQVADQLVDAFCREAHKVYGK